MIQKVSYNWRKQLSPSLPFFLDRLCCEHFQFTESSSGYREPKDKQPESSSSDSDDDEHGTSSEYTKPTTDKSKSQLDYIQQFFKHKLGLTHDDESEAHTQRVLKTLDFQGVVDHWKANGFKRIITMVGAGISTCKKIRKL